MVEYEQKAAYSDTVKALLILGFLLILSLFVFSMLKLFGFGADPQEQAVLSFVLILYGILMWGFTGMRFRVTEESVVAHFPPFRYNIPYSEISSVEILEKFPWYTGWGLRIQGRKLLFVGKHGRGVLINKKEGVFRGVIMVVENPDEFVKRVQTGVKSRQRQVNI